MKNNKKIELVKKVIKIVKEDFGDEPCKEINIKCANCQARILIAYLEDYLDYLYDTA